MKNKKSGFHLTGIFCLLILFSGCKHGADYYTRGVGIYPGIKSEDSLLLME